MLITYQLVGRLVNVALAPEIDPKFLEEWAASYLAAWNGHDPEGIALLCTEDVVWIRRAR
jgi:nuclear transport factor 2 (NTF2) superfamily protein